MKSYALNNWICCEDCKDSLEADHNGTSIELDASGVAEFVESTEREPKCFYCYEDIEHDSKVLSKLQQQSTDVFESDLADKTAWHNGRFGR